MLHHTHAFLGYKIFNSENSLLIVGSFLPDIAILKIIDWSNGLHGKENTNKFLNFIHSKYKEQDALSKGVLVHNLIDDFTHIEYEGKGYAFMNNKELAGLVSEFYKLNPERSKGIAHNYIESAVDIHLLKEYPEVQNKVKNATRDIDIDKLADILGAYFSIDPEEFRRELKTYFDLFTKYNFSDQNDWVYFWNDLENLLELDDIGDERRKKLISKSMDITKNTYSDFLNYSLRESKSRVVKRSIEN